MTCDITLERHIEELRAEFNASVDPIEREAIAYALDQARKAVADSQAENFWAMFLAPETAPAQAELPF